LPSVDSTKKDHIEEWQERIGVRECWSEGVSWKFADNCLPPHAFHIQLACWLVEQSAESLSYKPVLYLAERPMHVMLSTYGKTGRWTDPSLGDDDLMFLWQPNGNTYRGRAFKGENKFIKRGTQFFPADDRLDISIETLAAKDLFVFANLCDHPKQEDAIQQTLPKVPR
jgi:hypothetical protein